MVVDLHASIIHHNEDIISICFIIYFLVDYSGKGVGGVGVSGREMGRKPEFET
jgi:hypothetical protein